MRTRVIPAQITTVEDKIIGSLNLVQIVLLVGVVFAATVAFALVPPVMMITGVKTGLMVVCLAMGGILSIRTKGKLVVDWIVVLLRFNARPKFYVFDKNDTVFRVIDEATETKAIKQTVEKKVKKVKRAGVDIVDLVRLDNLVENNGLGIRFRSNGKGGLNVAFEKIGK